MTKQNWYQRLLSPIAIYLAKVTAIDIGRKDDGLIPFQSAGTPLDKDWGVLQEEFTDAIDAWRTNPLARRLINLTTAYVVGGDGIQLHSTYKPFDKFVTQFFNHPKNRILLRQPEWCDELSRAGEIFPILFTNPADGMSYIRIKPASEIEKIVTDEDDYETILAYHEPTDVGTAEPRRIWLSPETAPTTPKAGKITPVMLHYAVNKPIGCIRGESDLAPILPWLRRYSRWLEDRVRINAAIRAFLWIVHVPGKFVQAKREQYRTPPTPGSVIIADSESETWEAVTPSLNARDASADGRTLRWMIAAGGQGTGLTDLGEAESANLATASAMAEQRRRFLRRRQAYFSFIIADIAMQAWNRSIQLGLQRGKQVTIDKLQITTPDISPEDNQQLSSAASNITKAMTELHAVMAPSETLRRLTMSIILKFAGESITQEELDAIVTPEPFTPTTPAQNLAISNNGNKEKQHV